LGERTYNLSYRIVLQQYYCPVWAWIRTQAGSRKWRQKLALISGRTFVETVRPMLSDRCPICLSVLSVTLVYCGQTVRRIKMKLGMQVVLGPRRRSHCISWRPSSPSRRGHSPQFSAHVCRGQTAGLIKMPLGKEVGLGPGHIVR